LLRRTKIVCTLGPASSSRKTIEAMIDAGMDAVRLNFSHGDHESHRELIQRVRIAARRTDRAIPVIQDLQGPRFRVADLPDGYLDLKRGQTVTVGPRSRRPVIPVRPRFSFRGVETGHRIAVGDLGVGLRVVEREGTLLKCRVTRGGTIHSGKGVGFPDSASALPALTRKDMEDVEFGLKMGVDFVALSFVRSAADVERLRKRLGEGGPPVISKIETRQAVKDIDDIISASDAVLVTRGDLASGVSISRLPLVQKILVDKSNHRARPVIMATQMLESMISNPQPTRAEASDVANAVLDGSDALMLSGETAIGRYPAETVKMMASIIRRTERGHARGEIRGRRPLEPVPEVDETIAYLASDAARRLGASAIITSTMSGSTALRVVKFRPEVPVFAVTPSERTRMALGISYGVFCARVRHSRNTDEMIQGAIEEARKRGVVKEGETVVVTAGVPPWETGQTNLLKLETV
jgi:pyruvate kinase